MQPSLSPANCRKFATSVHKAVMWYNQTSSHPIQKNISAKLLYHFSAKHKPLTRLQNIILGYMLKICKKKFTAYSWVVQEQQVLQKIYLMGHRWGHKKWSGEEIILFILNIVNWKPVKNDSKISHKYDAESLQFYNTWTKQ